MIQSNDIYLVLDWRKRQKRRCVRNQTLRYSTMEVRGIARAVVVYLLARVTLSKLSVHSNGRSE